MSGNSKRSRTMKEYPELSDSQGLVLLIYSHGHRSNSLFPAAASTLAEFVLPVYCQDIDQAESCQIRTIR